MSEKVIGIPGSGIQWGGYGSTAVEPAFSKAYECAHDWQFMRVAGDQMAVFYCRKCLAYDYRPAP